MLRFSQRLFLYLFLLFLPVLTFGAYLFAHAVNVPYDDDEGLLHTINQIHNSPDYFFQTLIQQHNDHRIFFSRLASFTIDFLNGQMDFRIMIISGFFNLILLGHAFFLIFKSFNKNILYFIPVTILLFSPIVYATHIWSITAFEQTLAITFSLYCLYFLQSEKRRIWYFSIPLAIAATLSNLDGLSVIPIALVWLIVQRRSKESLLFGIFSTIYLYLFFIDFHLSSSSVFPHFPQIIPIVLKGFTGFTGSITKVISDSHVNLLSAILGGFILLVYAVIIAMKFSYARLKHKGFSISFPEICFLKLLACAFMIALGRAGDAEGSMFAVRFQIYSVGIFIMFYLFVLSSLENKRYAHLFFSGFLCSAVVLNLLSYVKYHNAIVFHTDKLKADAYNYSSHSLFIHQYFKIADPGYKLYSNYSFPNYFKNQMAEWAEQAKQQKQLSKVSATSALEPNLPEFEGCIYPVVHYEIKNLPSYVPGKNIYLALFNAGETGKPFLIAIQGQNKGWFSELLHKDPLVNSFSVTFPKKMPDKLYDVALCWTVNNVPKSLLIAKNFKMPQ
ncbi:hypothetical protein [Dyadobacter sp. NIV53]|uniref:hypothetical protein n=1 Tax=Dyadobacter sp. NIV53 TaxID=2861765 RepID=UPI001C870D88|nr:hypothetical protein [Dyadobacter sp. NIV53]